MAQVADKYRGLPTETQFTCGRGCAGSFGLIEADAHEKQTGHWMERVREQVTDHANTKAQPAPRVGRESVTDAIVQDLLSRREHGKVKYGTELMTHNGRDAMVDAYQEALDLVMYFKQTLMERDAKAELPFIPARGSVAVGETLRWVNSDIALSGRGFWHRDETEDLHGPYPTQEIAERALGLYIIYLNKGPNA